MNGMKNKARWRTKKTPWKTAKATNTATNTAAAGMDGV
jgi:hypothetical protein